MLPISFYSEPMERCDCFLQGITNMTKLHNIFCLALLLIVLCLLGCEQDTRVSIDGNNPPKFKLSGSGKVFFIRVDKNPLPESEMTKDEAGIWQIEPDESMRRATISRYPEIKYGEVPPGFIQKVPKNGDPPPGLEEGQEYILLAPTYNANSAYLGFKIKDGKSVELPRN